MKVGRTRKVQKYKVKYVSDEAFADLKQALEMLLPLSVENVEN